MAGLLCGYPDLNNGLGLAGSISSAMVLMAFRGTPYIKIGGKIHEYSASGPWRRADDDAPGDVDC